MHVGPEWKSALFVFLVGAMNATEFHRQSHLAKPHPVFQVLQKYRIALRHEDHMVHHQPPFATDFAIFNGWTNGLNRRLQLWKKLDLIWWKWMGKMPNNWIQDPRSIPVEVVQELEKDLDEVPSELWDYAVAYPQRVPDTMQPLLGEARTVWQNHFIENRRVVYYELALENREKAEADWFEEQKAYTWIYGLESIPLFLDSSKK